MCSPSFSGSFLYKKRYDRGISFLEQKGFKVTNGILAGKICQNQLSGSVFERSAEINQLFNQVDIVITSIGGYNSNSVLPYLDYEKYKKSNSIFIGYSDTTAIALALYAKTNKITFMSQSLICNYGEFPPFNELSYNSLNDILFSEENRDISYNQLPYWTDERSNWEIFVKPKTIKENEWYIYKYGRAKGILIAGNLDTIIGIIGTSYMPKIDENTILLLEETFSDFGRLYRNFSTLALHGVFDKISGLIISKIEYFERRDEIIWLLKNFVDKRDIPILLDFDCGHTHPSYLVPIGGEVSLILEKD
ncbi:LD-carboxypeptidase [Streptococcus suis]|uniref:S66 family peptidase n=1 Tax=Streptococcus suis TaxID=1307 RepID=UPI0007692320|nr:S66 peptidase family protein [Streptococcus suis]NRG80142.1 LD-carboxypeptidase [Streptococcus suis]CZA70097.1 microcin immunity protein [Streptococcus suis]CZB30485.1 microcin immunity protein [Streptococcus suis]